VQLVRILTEPFANATEVGDDRTDADHQRRTLSDAARRRGDPGELPGRQDVG
jgi:hypothetical protein